ncbi:5-(carboxyamino)imidazole ribonucleotide synthase [Halobacteriales archaeon QS_8_69_26]|nr:MAG: 5-(carboxyamino)imidazole ribonucleotide synthase [Halobacteriales archaeon QS_8_69_26]
MIGGDGPTLGVVGGGQLGRMLAEAAAALGVEVVVADPTPDPPAAPVARDALVGGFDDPETLGRLADRADALTIEIELVDPGVLERVAEEAGVPVHPSPDTLRMIRDKLVQKRRLREAGVPVPAFRPVEDEADLLGAIEEFGEVMVKARRGGYDGRGNVPVRSREEAAEALDAVSGPAMAEEMIEFDRELSVIAVQGDGEVATFPAGENVHEDEILRETVAPARTHDEVRERAQSVAGDVLDLMDGRGVYGVELFEVDGEVLVNEIAPRPHNSGHYTIEGAVTSQFGQHVRCVLGWPLGSTALRDPVAMSNLLGDVETARPLTRGRSAGEGDPAGSDDPRPARLTGVDRVLATPGASMHWYGKREVRPLRKMGHVTVVPTEGEGREALLGTARELTDGLTFADR